MVTPVQRQASSSSHPATTTSAPAAAPRTASNASASVPPPALDVRRQAADDVQVMQLARTAPTSPSEAGYRRAIDEAARIYLEDGPGDLRDHLAENSGALSALANVDARRLERDLEASLDRQASGARSLITGADATTIAGMVECVAGARIRQGIVQEVGTIVAARLRGMDQMSEALPGRLETLRNARPGTPEAIEARYLGIRGDSGDLERARAAIAQAREGLQTFANRMRGQSWEPGEFPDAAGRAARRLNLEGAAASAGMIAAASTENPNEAVHVAVLVAEGAHIVHEVHQSSRALTAAEVAAGAAGLTVSIVGVIIGLTVGHFSHEAHEEHLAFGHGLGL